MTTAAGESSQIVGGSGGAVAFNQGAGEIDIKYIPTDHLRDQRGAIGHGHRTGAGTDQYHGRDQPALQGDQLRRIVPMRPRDRRSRPAAAARPILEGLEPRESPSATPVAAATASPRSPVRPSAAIVAHPESPNGLLGQRAPGGFLDTRVLQQVAAALYPAICLPARRRRARSVARPSRHDGPASTRSVRLGSRIGPARSISTASRAAPTSSSRGSSRSRSSLRRIPTRRRRPAIPTPTRSLAWPPCSARTTSSRAVCWCSTSTARRPRVATPDALPTQLTWTYDNNTSGGPYAVAGRGRRRDRDSLREPASLQIRWSPDPHPAPGTSGSGQVVVTFQGLINTSQIVSGVSKFIS